MDIRTVFAVACVSDMERSIAWYRRLLGREPDDRPMEGLVQWRYGRGAGIQLVLDGERSGRSLITLVIGSLGAARGELGALGLELEPEIAGDFGALAQISDPDGNRITLAESPEGM